MIGSSDNSGGVVVEALVCGTEYSRFKSRFILFSTSQNFLSSRRISVNNDIRKGCGRCALCACTWGKNYKDDKSLEGHILYNIVFQ